MLVNRKYLELANLKEDYLTKDIRTMPVPAPIGGWDSISPLASMEPQYAPTLTNWVVRPGFIELRGGYNAWCQGLSTGPVETLMTHRPANGAEKLFGIANGTVWDVSVNGLPVKSLTGLANNRFQYVNFTPAGAATYLVMCNGIDAVKEYDGTTWTSTDTSITGVPSSSFDMVHSHMRRLWFVRKNTTEVWYLPIDAITGAATKLDLGPFFTKGGYLLSMASYTLDGGSGPNDLAVFLSSRGQVAVYQGQDPSNAATWSIVGVFNLPTPVPVRRGMLKIGSDIAIITLEGLIPLSKALPYNPSGVRSVAFTQRIQNAMLLAAQTGGNLFGWQTTLFPQQSLMIMNVPLAENNTQQQYVMNGINGAWSNFTGWNANCFEIFNNSLYFADNTGSVNLAYTGGLDLLSPIIADAQCAYNFFGEPGRLKDMSMVRPFIFADGTISPTITVNIDFNSVSPSSTVQTIQPSGAIWDSSLWDTGRWSSGPVSVNNWQSVQALGTALSLRIKVNVAPSTANNILNSVFDTGVFDSMVFDGSGSVTASSQNLVTLQINAFETLLEFGGPI